MKYEYKTHAAYRGYGWIEPLTDSEDSLIEDHLARRICEELNTLQAECTLLRAQLDAMTEHKMAAHQLIGIPASVGICEPIEGFAARPQDIMPAVRDMALKIEALQSENERLRKDVAHLAEALEDIGASWHGEGYMRNVARRALAAYHKGSES